MRTERQLQAFSFAQVAAGIVPAVKPTSFSGTVVSHDHSVIANAAARYGTPVPSVLNRGSGKRRATLIRFRATIGVRRFCRHLRHSGRNIYEFIAWFAWLCFVGCV